MHLKETMLKAPVDALTQLQTGFASSHHLRIKTVYLESHLDYKSSYIRKLCVGKSLVSKAVL